MVACDVDADAPEIGAPRAARGAARDQRHGPGNAALSAAADRLGGRDRRRAGPSRPHFAVISGLRAGISALCRPTDGLRMTAVHPSNHGRSTHDQAGAGPEGRPGARTWEAATPARPSTPSSTRSRPSSRRGGEVAVSGFGKFSVSRRNGTRGSQPRDRRDDPDRGEQRREVLRGLGAEEGAQLPAAAARACDGGGARLRRQPPMRGGGRGPSPRARWPPWLVGFPAPWPRAPSAPSTPAPPPTSPSPARSTASACSTRAAWTRA